uniref:BAH domain-containing protein n=1 Tax=Anopheles culicifacies TaxID=139723 RepID=A0A182M7A2_9DIPT
MATSYYQPAGPLISPHLLGQPPSQHGPKSGPDGETLLQSPQQPPASSTADSTDSDVLLTGTPGRPANDHPMGFHPLRPRAAVAVAAAAAAADDADRYFRSIFPGGGVDLGHRSQPYGASRYGPAPGGGGPPGNLYPRPMQMHCPPTYLSPGYYAPSPYGPQPPPPHGPPPEMYYTHAYPAHFYPKFAPPYYPTSRRYYAGPGPGPEHHLYEQAPPPSSAQGPPGPPPPPSGAQLVPAGPQGPQHLDHYPYPPYPGYGSPGPGSGGQCYPRNLQHPPPPPAYMDAHYTTNCPCPMQCPKNVNAGSLIGIKASKGPVATNNHILQNQAGTRISSTEPITISSSSSSASSSSSPMPVDSPVTTSATTPVRQASADNESSSNATSKQQTHPPHGYHAHHHHGSALQMEMHPPGAPTHHPHTYPYHFHHHHPGPLHHSQHGPIQSDAAEKTAVTATSTSTMTTLSTGAKHTPAIVTTAASGTDTNLPEKMCYKTELPITPDSVTELLSTPMHYGSPYHHPYHHPIGYYHHAKLSDLKEEQHGTLTPPYSISSKMKLLETPEMSPVRVSTVLNAAPVLSAGDILQPSIKGTECSDKTHCTDKDKLTGIPVSTAIVKQEIEEFKLLEPLDGTVCKKEDFEETGPAMTPDLLDESIVIKKDRDEIKPITRTACHPEHPGAHPHASVDHHHLHHTHHLQQMRVAAHLPHHLHHHSASTNLLHGTPQHHHQHAHYNMQHPHQQQQQPLITGLLVEKDDVETDAKLPPDSKSLLTELVLTTEASMVESSKKTTQSILTTSPSVPEVATVSTTKSAVDVTAKMDATNGICKSPSQQPRGNSSDNSFSLSDSLTPNVAGAPEQLSSISKNIVKVQSHDSCAGSLDPPSPVSIPASTVKRRPLLVACKKATPKQSPPNSYKNLIKRTNGLEDEDGHQPPCPEPVELSEEDEEEDEEDEEEEEDPYEEEEDEEDALQDEQIEDVEDIELQEQRKVEVEKSKTRQREPLTTTRSHKQSVKKRLIQRKLSVDRSSKGCKRNLVRSSGTSHYKLPRRQLCFESKKLTGPTVISPERARSVRRYYRVFRSSIESLKRLPMSIRKRLLRRSNITPMRRNVQKRSCKSQQKSSEMINEAKDIVHHSDTQPLLTTCGNSNDIIIRQNKLPNNVEQCPEAERLMREGQNDESVNKINETVPVAMNANAVMKPLSNVDRTIDLVAKGYFSEPEILNGTELQMHSRAWLKKLKQQQEGRSHSEQSRGTKCRDQKIEGSTKKCKSKCSSLVLDASSPQPTTPATKDKKPKSKSSKHTPLVAELQLEASNTVQCKEGKSKKKASSSKERKKDQSSRKRKQKELSDDNDDSHARKRSNPSSEMAKAGESLYQRATSTPISVPIGEMSLAMDQDDREEDGRKVGAVGFDDSVVTLMDHSSVIDDRETDFDDAATMLVEDDVASVDTNVLVNRHNNNNNSTVTDKNNMIQEQQRIAAEQLVLAAPMQAIIAEGKEGSELEPPEGMEPFMDEQLEEEVMHTNVQLAVPNHLSEVAGLQQQQCPPVESSIGDASPSRVHLSYDDEYEDLEDDELLPKRGSSRSVKRRRSRSKTKSKKFSTKKRHRPSTNRAMTVELEELIVPKKCTSIPRWSNGWTWEGQPFQGKVFLNSDDPPVLRTCYPAMRHSVGDIIKPRDCVLLKAGSKRAELPYVAKVAHLWENPDDGEMMMSLLWYYRPEHTEQGRQRTDGPDEVFASRHKDHNSVACIEDKCYVLTFSEYCRFRRQLKGYEENIEEQPSIVPPLRRENPRLPPPIVSPELVMYCQRVYEFRQKRLLKSTS